MQLDLRDKQVLVMGLGVHGGGVGVTRWLIKQGARVTVTDLRTEDTLSNALRGLKGLPVTYVLGRHRVNDFKKADLVIKNPAVPNNSPYLVAARKAGVPVETATALFFLYCPVPIIGITGSKGKSTVTALIGHLFRTAGKRPFVVGNMGGSPFDIIDKIGPTRAIIFELSSWDLEGLAKHKISPHVAVLTNVYHEHLNRYSSFAAYSKAKSYITEWQSAGDLFVVNRDNAEAAKIGRQTPAERLWVSVKPFAEENGIFIRQGQIVWRFNGVEKNIVPVEKINLPGQHNQANAMAAVAVALRYKLSLTAIRKGLQTFEGLEHRLQLVRQRGGVAWYNDTTATQPDAAINAIETLAQAHDGVVLIAGGTDKKLSFDQLAAVIHKQVKHLILLPGTATDKLRRQLNKRGYSAVTTVAGMQTAIHQAAELASSGDAIVLSPGAASFGLFKHEFDRGDQFVVAVKALPKLK